jgi:hypothetical protein
VLFHQSPRGVEASDWSDILYGHDHVGHDLMIRLSDPAEENVIWCDTCKMWVNT